MRLSLRSLFVLFAALACGSAGQCAWAEGNAEQRQAEFQQQVRPFLSQYCFDCHSGESPDGELRLDDLRASSKIATQQRKTWKKVHDKLFGHVMPPEDADQPAKNERERIVAWLRTALDDYDCDGPANPGRETIRRLTRYEYKNTVRDLLGVEAKLADDFPLDDVGYGFDNIGDVLSLSPLLMEKYLAAAEQIAGEVIITDPLEATARRRIDAVTMQGAGNRIGGDWRILTTTGDFRGQIDVPADGEYIVRVHAYADRGGDELAKMRVTIDGGAKVFDVEAERDKPANHDFRAQLQRGRRNVNVAFLNDFYQPNHPNPRLRDRNLAVRRVEIIGPMGRDGLEYPQPHRRVVFVRPGDKVSVEQATRQIIERLATRAFRRPATDGEVQRLVRLVEIGQKRGGRWEHGIQLALTAVLTSPHFLFKVEQDPTSTRQRGVRDLNEYELATRLSYFLWSSMPDDELFELARRGQLRSQLDAQVRRMLRNPKSDALVENFALQWLQLRNLKDMEPDRRKFREWNDRLREDMLTEARLFLRAIVREDRSVLELIEADFTFLNQRLAEHYGIGGIRGDEFQRVGIQATQRGGVMTMGAVLTVTSNPTRTSPVKRGKWIMETILGTPPPDPPADVPDLDETAKVNPNVSLREQLEIHRNNERCATCHRQMDALGLAMENFDAVGRWRQRDGRFAIDPSGVLPDGQKFEGPSELKRSLFSKRKDKFARCLSEKLLTYALGRGVEYYDRCAIDGIQSALAEDRFKFSRLIIEIARSEPFQKRTWGN